MKTSTGLTLVAIGAIIAFAITAHMSFLNLQVVGWIFILTGITGLLVPRRGHGWQRRSVLLRGGPRASAAKTVEQPALTLGSGDSGEATNPKDEPIEREQIVEYIEK